ncbi:MAG: tripartite tricarboxylate transporter substrate binding protein [Roseomonas sp.]|nr:tripartite tricarboxylate transporter substrate binding protein [Roseomonas sp.]
MARLTRRGTMGLLLATPALAHAQAPGAWPTRTVRYIDLFQPGGGPDIFARIYCAALSEMTGQQFVVENRVGAGGTVGATVIARSVADGYTIGLGGIGTHAIAQTLYARLPYDAMRDFTFMGGLYRGPSVLLVRADSPIRSIPDLIETAKREPGRRLYGHGGLGTSPHLAMELFKARAGVDIPHVAYNGPAALVDLMGGRVDLVMFTLVGAMAGLREGKWRGLALTGGERNAAAPDIPSMAEFLPGFDITAWTVLTAPAGIPPELVGQIYGWSKRALERPDVVRRLADLGQTPWPVTPEESLAWRAQQEALLAPLVRASGARVE